MTLTITITITLTLTVKFTVYGLLLTVMIGETELRVYGLGSIGKVPEEVYVGLVVLFVVGMGFLLWKKGWREGLRASSVLLLVEWVFLIFCTAVFFRESGESSRINLTPLSSYFDIAKNSYLVEAAAVNAFNFILFIPIGLLLGFGFKKITWKKVLLIGLGISFSIELLQFIFKRGLCEVDDLIHNLIGCVIGFLFYRLLIRLTKYVQEIL